MEIKMYDYSTEAEYIEHKEEMEEKGYKQIDSDMFNGSFQTGKLEGSEKFTYTASYIKSKYM